MIRSEATPGRSDSGAGTSRLPWASTHASTSSSENSARLELLEHGPAGLRGAATEREQLAILTPPQAALEPPVALDDEVIVEVLRVHVRGPNALS